MRNYAVALCSLALAACDPSTAGDADKEISTEDYFTVAITSIGFGPEREARVHLMMADGKITRFEFDRYAEQLEADQAKQDEEKKQTLKRILAR